ncbi:MAG: ribonuclease III [Anaerolineae bacterium]|nr:ribonuclease III [Anaerolineae bacterium]
MGRSFTHPLEQILHYEFRDPALLQQALTHSSYVNENRESLLSDNERLEYLGDAVLDFMVAEWLFREHPNLTEGEMTNLRARLVREDTLARLAQRIRLGEHLLLGKGEAESGGRSRPHNLCAAFEALVGAVYLDADLDVVRATFKPILAPELERALRDQSARDPKSLLQEWVQARYRLTPTYETISEEGPDHAKVFTVQVVLNDRVLGVGTGASKQAAAQQAASAALRHLQAENSIPS